MIGGSRTVSLILFLALVAFWMIWIPGRLYGWLPHSFVDWLGEGSTGSLLILFLAVPALLGLFAACAGVCWIVLVSFFMSRRNVEAILQASPFGGKLGKLENSLLDRVYHED